MQKPKIKITVIGRKGPCGCHRGHKPGDSFDFGTLPFPISTFCATAVQFPELNPARQYFAAPMSIRLTFLRLKWQKMNKNKSELRKIPFIGPNIEQDLLNIGISRIADLKGKDPEELYRMDCEFKGRQEDLCQLYVFRMAVYYADTENPDPEKLKWWYWKDK